MLDIESAIENMCSIDWLGRAGLRDEIVSTLQLHQVTSWEKALDLRGRAATSDAFSEGRGMLTRDLSSRFRSDYRNWNRIAGRVREELEGKILPAVDAVVDANAAIARIESGSELVKRSVRWDLMHYAMEFAYSQLVSCRFYPQAFGI